MSDAPTWTRLPLSFQLPPSIVWLATCGPCLGISAPIADCDLRMTKRGRRPAIEAGWAARLGVQLVTPVSPPMGRSRPQKALDISVSLRRYEVQQWIEVSTEKGMTPLPMKVQPCGLFRSMKPSLRMSYAVLLSGS